MAGGKTYSLIFDKTMQLSEKRSSFFFNILRR
jgi:hypothetical protein